MSETTIKNNAAALVEKFYNEIHRGKEAYSFEVAMEKHVHYALKTIERAKQCAIISVEEMLAMLGADGIHTHDEGYFIDSNTEYCNKLVKYIENI